MIGSPRARGIAVVVAWWLLHAVTPAFAQAAGDPASSAPRPYREGVRQPLEFRGAERDEPAPDVQEVALGWFGPGDPGHPAYGTLWRGATLAIEEANAAGGYLPPAPPGSPGRPFRLLPAWSESPWQAGIGSLLRLVYDAHLWAVIGGVDGTTTHLALQVALKSHFTLVTPGSSDASTERAHVPWLFSLAPSDDALAAAVVPALAEASRGGSCAVASSAEHDGHAALDAFTHAWTKRALSPAALVEYAPSDPAPSVARLVASRPKAVLVLGPAPAAGALVKQLRAAGYAGALLGGATATGHAFHAAAGDAAEGLVAPSWIVPGPAWDAFASAYERRWHETPDGMAASGYDAVRLVAEAVRRAGLNRARIRDAIAALSPWDGASGPVRFSPIGRNERDVRLGSWRGGRFVGHVGQD